MQKSGVFAIIARLIMGPSEEPNNLSETRCDFDTIVSNSELIKRNYKWVIPNFKLRLNCYNESSIASPLIRLNDDLVWQITLTMPPQRPSTGFPLGGSSSRTTTEDSSSTTQSNDRTSGSAALTEPLQTKLGYYGLKIKLVQKREDFVDKFRVTLYILGLSGSKLYPYVTYDFSTKDQVLGTSSYFQVGNGLDYLLVNDNLTVCMDLEILKLPSIKDDGSIIPPHPKVKVPDPQLSTDLAKLLNSSEFCDVVIDCDGEQFPCTKAILAARSPLFDCMFRNGFGDLEPPKPLIIKNTTPDVMKILLEFIYTDKIPDFKGNNIQAIDVLIGANTYGLYRLKAATEEEVLKTLSLNRVCNVLQIAHCHLALQAKKVATDYFRRFSSSIIKTDAWTELERNNPKLAIELLKSIIAPNPTEALQSREYV